MEPIALLLFVGVLAWIWYLQRRSHARKQRLARDGRHAEATVLRRFTRSKPKMGRRYFLEYRFRTDDGREITQIAGVTAQDHLDHDAGDRVVVVYDPASPGDSRLLSDLARRGYVPREP